MLLQTLTDRELLSCHAVVKALQDQFGVSYKDASHHLYLAEVEKLEQQDITLKTYVTLKKRLEDNLESFEWRFADIMARTPYHEHSKAVSDSWRCGITLELMVWSFGDRLKDHNAFLNALGIGNEVSAL